MPCPDYNRSDPPTMPPGLVVTVDEKGPRHWKASCRRSLDLDTSLDDLHFGSRRSIPARQRCCGSNKRTGADRGLCGNAPHLLIWLRLRSLKRGPT